MKKEESQVLQYLKAQGYTNIQYEPDGNIPPDFLLNGRIAIEVRRLNKYITIGNRKEPIEKADYQVQALLQKITDSIQTPDYKHSIYLFLDFKRPLNIKQYKNSIISTLNNHLKTPEKIAEYRFGTNLIIRTFPANQKLATIYRIGGSSDDDSGGFIVSDIYNVLPHILSEKEGKISKYKSRYPEWWLALVDTIGYGFSSNDLAQFKQLPLLNTDFDKVLLISPLDHTRGFTIIG